MEKYRNIYSEQNYDKFCSGNPLINYCSSSTNEGVLVNDRDKLVVVPKNGYVRVTHDNSFANEKYYIKKIDNNYKEPSLDYVSILIPETIYSSSRSFMLSSIAKKNPILADGLVENILRLATSHLKNEPTVKIQTDERVDSSKFIVSKDSALLVQEYIKEEGLIYTQDSILNKDMLKNLSATFGRYDTTPLVEDLRRHIGETIFKLVTLLSVRARYKGIDEIPIVDCNVLSLSNEIGYRLLGQFSPKFDKIDEFNKLLSRDLLDFVLEKRFKGGWGELIYSSQKNLITVKVSEQMNDYEKVPKEKSSKIFIKKLDSLP